MFYEKCSNCGQPFKITSCTVQVSDDKQITALQAQVDEAKQILRNIIREKELHGQVVDGTMEARKFLDKR